MFDDGSFFILLYLLTQLALFLQVTPLLSVTWNWEAWPVAIVFG